ncbi:MAG: hypothetical protein CENE_03629 [Candidatus Celerinatantimonas neptuna]|nr:MAG: hypothetical protein CENE_03629 [Candidatus Celerinatantimonas neptuna]
MKKTLLSTVSALVMLGVVSHAEAGTTNFTAKQQEQIGQIAANYLLEHPEILIQVSQKLRAKEQQEQQAHLVTSAVKMQKSLMDLQGIPHSGPKNAKVTVTEFFDYQCFYCNKMAPVIEQVMKKNPNVKFIFRDWPIFASRWKNSAVAAQTGLAVWKQKGVKAYLSYHNGIYGTGHNEGKLKQSDITQVAQKALSGKLKNISDKAYRQIVNKNNVLARTLGFSGTPGLIIMPSKNATTKNTVVIGGAVPARVLQAAIDKASH